VRDILSIQDKGDAVIGEATHLRGRVSEGTWGGKFGKRHGVKERRRKREEGREGPGMRVDGGQAG